MAEPLHIQAPDAMSALLLRHRLNAMNLDADMIPVGEVWDVRVFISGDDAAAAVRRLMEEEGIYETSSLGRA
jgi:cysteine synthase